MRRSSSHGSHNPSHNPAWFAQLPEKIKKRHFSKDERVFLTNTTATLTKRESIILDAVNEVVYKIGRRSSRHLTPSVYTPSLVTPRDSMDSSAGSNRRDLELNRPARPAAPTSGPNVPASFMDSFRWLEEDENLDLKLFLDDYHANLRDTLPETKHRRKGSFRRHLSITKIPFGRPSLSSSRPGTKDIAANFPVSPTTSGLPSPSPSPLASTFQHEALPKSMRSGRRSRTLSLISTHNTKTAHPTAPESMIDPEAAHYQDPEARLKLRVYLASPQKFDEAVEFGFPSREVICSQPSKEVQNHKRRESKMLGMPNKENEKESGTGKLKTFLDDGDDKSSVYSDEGDASMADPESPLTPQTPLEKPAIVSGVKPTRLSTLAPTTDAHSSFIDPYAEASASGREMTLRMTLTRPDLRACEEQIYGWQNVGGRKSTTMRPAGDFAAVTYLDGHKQPKQSMEQMFANFDAEKETSSSHGGVMRRFWDKMKHH